VPVRLLITCVRISLVKSAGLQAAHQGGAHTIAAAIATGQTHQAIAHVAPQARATVGEVARASFVAGLNEIFLVAAIVAFAGAVAALLWIRSSDFLAQTKAPPNEGTADALEPATA